MNKNPVGEWEIIIQTPVSQLQSSIKHFQQVADKIVEKGVDSLNDEDKAIVWQAYTAVVLMEIHMLKVGFNSMDHYIINETMSTIRSIQKSLIDF
jgi:hypothetical protein